MGKLKSKYFEFIDSEDYEICYLRTDSRPQYVQPIDKYEAAKAAQTIQAIKQRFKSRFEKSKREVGK